VLPFGVACLGVMKEPDRLGVKRCAAQVTSQPGDLFGDTESRRVEVDVKRVCAGRSRKFGGPWLGLELLCQFLRERGRRYLVGTAKNSL